jgi:thiaminase (transcriptional activator TenA)
MDALSTETGTVTAEIWAAIAPAHERILEHPFLLGLTDGTLPRDAFARYVIQDGLYLSDYARSLALCGARAVDVPTLEMFCMHAATAVAVERTLHASLLGDLGIEPAEAAAAETNPVCLAYGSYIKAVCALGERHEAIAAMLPCYWIYREVGRSLLERGSPDLVYARWIETYGGEEFDDAVRRVLAAVDAAGANLGPDGRAAMVRHARVSARYEWMFWDAPHADLRWPELGF